jgi:hypothetical protein
MSHGSHRFAMFRIFPRILCGLHLRSGSMLIIGGWLGLAAAESGNSNAPTYISAGALLVSFLSLLVSGVAYRGSRPRVTIDYRIRSHKRDTDPARQTTIHFYIRNRGGHDTELSGWHLDVLEPGVSYKTTKAPERTGDVDGVWTVRGHGFVRFSLYIEVSGTDAPFTPLELSVHLANGRQARSSGLLVPTDAYPDWWFGT